MPMIGRGAPELERNATVRLPMRTRVSLAVAAAILLSAGGCGGGDDASRATPEPVQTPFSPSSSAEQAPKADEQEAAASLGFPGFATKNTTRVGGADPVANAVGVALAVYPSASADSRPRAVSLVDVDDWRAGISAAQLMSKPLGAPVLLSQEGRLPPATAQGLDVLRPRGAGKLGGAGVVRIGPGAARVGSGAKTLPVTAS